MPAEPPHNSQPIRSVPRDALLDRSALIAGGIACLLPLLSGASSGWSASRIVSYIGISLIYVVLLQQQLYAQTRLGRWLCTHQRSYLVLSGILATALLALSGDYLIQPIVFTIPFVQGLLGSSKGNGLGLGGSYLSLMALGLWLSGQRTISGIGAPVAVYGALMVFMAAFVRLAQEQQAARQQADELAATLAQERDMLAALAAENAQLAEQASATATLAERNRVARELHDTIAQGLTAISMQIEAAQRAFERDPERAQVRLQRAQSLARETLTEVRTSVWALADAAPPGEDFPTTLHTSVQRFHERTGISTHYTHSGGACNLSADAAHQALRIVQEALTNAEKHAQAHQISIHAACTDGAIIISITDDGCGFSDLAVHQHTRTNGFGLHSMHERARLANGTLSITSQPGNGTRIELRLPVA
jgi:signal transduction histidine kinase